LPTEENRYDFVGKITNANKDFLLKFDYYFIVNGQKTKQRSSFIYPSEAEYLLLLNQDIYLKNTVLEDLSNFLDNNKDVSAVSPRLMYWDFNNIKKSLDLSFSNKIDSLGLQVFRNRKVIEIGSGKEWRESNNDRKKEVFGVSGALPMYRVSNLKEVSFSDNYFFDSLYHSYKEDVDLAYRLRVVGYKAFILLNTIAYHDRSAKSIKKGNINALKNKKKQSDLIQYHSYKNHLMTIYKNEYWQNFLLDFVFIIWYELKKFFYYLLFNKKVLKGYKEIWKNRKILKRHRNEIKKINYREIRKWFK